jgi:signal transduction histidine kinase
MANCSERANTGFITPGISVACLTATGAGLLKAATSAELSAFQLALVIALGSLYAFLLTWALHFVERRGTRAHVYVLLTVAVTLGAGAVVLSRGSAFLLLMPIITVAVLFLSRGGTAGLIAICTAVTVASWVLRGPSAGEMVRDLAIWIAAMVFVLVVSQIVLSQHRARTEVESLARELREANDQLRAQAASIEELAKTKERNRIARDIHDGLGHYLTVVHVQLEAAQVLLVRDPRAAREALLKAQELTREGLVEVRRSVALLRGSAPQRQLVAAIEKLADECSADGIETELKLSGTPRPLPEPVETTLYRAAQEALTNVRRHARASRLNIELAFAACDVIRLCVQDDGVGADGVAQGFGLIGLRERAESVGGRIAVRSARGKGFTLEVELPG